MNRCPREYFFKYILNRATAAHNKAFTEGIFLHYILEQYYLQRRAQNYNLDTLIELARIKAIELPDLLISETEELIDLIKAYIAHHFQETWTIQEVEKPFAKILYEDEKLDLRIVLKGKADLLILSQGIEVIVDHKKISQNKTPSPRNNQILSYCFGFDRFDFIINQLGTQKSLKPEDKFKRHYFNVTAEQIKEWREETIYSCFEVVKFSEAKHWPARIASCWNPISGRVCDFHRVCQSTKENWEYLLTDSGEYQKRLEFDIMGSEK